MRFGVPFSFVDEGVALQGDCGVRLVLCRRSAHRRLPDAEGSKADAVASVERLRVCQFGVHDGQWSQRETTKPKEATGMGLAQGALAGTGDNPLPFIVGGVVVVALIVLVAAFVLMRRK
ncbi:hypothetical protein B5F40_12325 [Gordonibacter sp. An230]|nr:hypothetical protein B5F40_12325 [Gordonibacter sp. An230]